MKPNRFAFSDEVRAEYKAEFELVDRLYGEIEGAPGNLLDTVNGDPHDHLAAFLAAEIVSAIEAADDDCDRRQVIRAGLVDAADVLHQIAAQL